MQENNLICSICNKIIKSREEATYQGKDIITKKDKYRHRSCSPHGIIRKSRGHWQINPKTRVKESDKIYNRNKSKQKFLKEQKEL